MPVEKASRTITYTAEELRQLIADVVKKNLPLLKYKYDLIREKDPDIDVSFNIGSKTTSSNPMYDGPVINELVSCTVTISNAGN